jgi:hypothetical protein
LPDIRIISLVTLKVHMDPDRDIPAMNMIIDSFPLLRSSWSSVLFYRNSNLNKKSKAERGKCKRRDCRSRYSS